MAEHDVLGRDVHAWADSELDAPAAVAVKALWSWCGLDGGDGPNHLWTFDVTGGTDGFQVSAVVKDANVYVAPAYPSVPASVAELARQADGTEAAVDNEVDGETAADTAADEGVPVEEVVAEEAAAAPAVEAPVAPETPAEAPAPEAPAEAPAPDAPAA